MKHSIIKKAVLGSVLFGTGLGLGGAGMLFVITNDHPTIVVEEKWRTIESTPTTAPPGHTSLNADEIKTILSLEAQPSAVYLNPQVDPKLQIPPTTVTTKPVPLPPTTTIVTRVIPQLTTTLPPSTLPPSSTTLTTETPSTTTTSAPATTTTAETTTN